MDGALIASDTLPVSFLLGMIAGAVLLGLFGRVLINRPRWLISVGTTAAIFAALALPDLLRQGAVAIAGPVPFLLAFTLLCVPVPAWAGAAIGQRLIVRRG